jgi:hypothetical protein
MRLSHKQRISCFGEAGSLTEAKAVTVLQKVQVNDYILNGGWELADASKPLNKIGMINTKNNV